MSVHPLPRQRGGAAQLFTAQVDRVDHDGCRLAPGAPTERACIAAGCLLQPQPGDRVLLLCCDGAPAFVTCVLERAGPCGCLRLPGGSELRSDDGGLRLHAAQLHLLADAALSARAPDLALQAARCRLAGGSLELRVGRLQALLGTLRLRGRECLARLGRSFSECGDSVRRIRGIDETHAAQQRVHVEHRLHIQCHDTSILAENHVRVDARHIDLG